MPPVALNGSFSITGNVFLNPPDLVTSGLVLFLDSGNTSSYPGSGTTWTDLTGNGYNTSFLSSPTFVSGTSSYSGTSSHLNFNGTAYTEAPNVTGTSVANTFTFFVWARPTTTHGIDTESTSGTGGTSGQRYLLFPYFENADGGAGISAGTNGVSVYEHGDAYMPSLLTYQATISSTVFTNITVVYNSKQPTLYINGTSVRTGLTSLRPNVYGKVWGVGGSNTYGNFVGDIAVVMAYNRALSASEIQTNYDYFRGRYGL